MHTTPQNPIKTFNWRSRPAPGCFGIRPVNKEKASDLTRFKFNGGVSRVSSLLSKGRDKLFVFFDFFWRVWCLLKLDIRRFFVFGFVEFTWTLTFAASFLEILERRNFRGDRRRGRRSVFNERNMRMIGSSAVDLICVGLTCKFIFYCVKKEVRRLRRHGFSTFVKWGVLWV